MRAIGQAAENFAAAYLQSQGYTILAQNVSYPFGELDIIARDAETLVFIEVKHRHNVGFSAPYEAVTPAKQRKIIRAAQAWLQKWPDLAPLCRFDVISLVGDLKRPTIEHLTDAFMAED